MADEIIKWICPKDGTYNGGNFCIRCGLPRPTDTVREETVSSKTVQEETVSEETLSSYADEAEEVAEETPVLSDTEDTDAVEVIAEELRSAPAEQPSPDRENSTEKRGVSGIFSDTRERIGELCGDAAAYVSRMELVQDIKTDKKSRRTFIIAAAGALLLLFLLFALFLAPRLGFCVLFHRYAEASCAAPETCAICGRQRGKPLAHSFAPATCTEAATCTVCGATEGEALGHQWVEADCTRAKHCTVCGAIEGEPHFHTPGESVVTVEPTILEPGSADVVCVHCGQVVEKKTLYLDSFAKDDGFVFTATEYAKLMLNAKEAYGGDFGILVLTDEATGTDSLNFYNGTDKLAACVLYDHSVKPVKLDEGGKDPVYVVRWSFEHPGDQEFVKTVVAGALATLSPKPVDAATLMQERDMAVDGLRYIYENDGFSLCRLTVINMNACGDQAVSELINGN